MHKTLVMIHGMWGGGWYWDNYRRFFEARGYRCLTPDLRHHGMPADRAPPPELGTTSLLDYAADLEAEIRKLPEPPVLLGHSMGGLLAQILASRGCAEAAVCITPAAPAGILALRYSVLKSFFGIFTRGAFWRHAHLLAYERAVYAMMHRLPEAERRDIYARCGWESGRAMAEIGLWPLGFKGAQVDESRVNCPVLVVAASEDRITPACVVHRVARKYQPQSTYMEFTGHAHWILKEPGWEKPAAQIAAWLDVQ
ncbi:Pimeloyl-ACP methyl ester carboxylesterase [Modicisalibacter ilicicola DSM 19980]|uniref:Pimeloyl-ACP methyl ester carboxylesterase n=1 Tax=Modicisalibacter ilicicola DSM 19980 TaxID=1121942 RepID=A0A1M5F971_9GAMM|nr:alpha/beta hydrolase [Halomonas ilicicola]SHF87601.1 Pimeloyl-ACP methyl ester carboxylesterase [Halomonas ilicicola DSM 19980]